jgi:transposase
VHTSRTKRSANLIALLEVLDGLYGPKPGVRMKPVIIVLDNGPIYVSKATIAALAARAHWLTVEWLPKYAPELNDIEVVWHDLKAHQLAHQTFTGADALDRTIHAAVTTLNIERKSIRWSNRESLLSSAHPSRAFELGSQGDRNRLLS